MSSAPSSLLTLCLRHQLFDRHAAGDHRRCRGDAGPLDCRGPATKTMLERTRDCFGLKPQRLAADAAYGSGLMIGWLMRHEIEPHIPLLDREHQTNGFFTRANFTFDPQTNVFVCPEANSSKAPAWYARTALYPIWRVPRTAASVPSNPAAPRAKSGSSISLQRRVSNDCSGVGLRWSRFPCAFGSVAQCGLRHFGAR